MGNRTLGDAVRCWMADCFGFRLKSSCLKFRGSTGTRRWWTAAQACLVALCVLVAWTAVATTYVYDAQGRLVVVTNDAGTSARYLYDKMGNLTQIERLAAGQLAIFSFNPTRGGAGATVKVRGQGFSTTPSLNTLKFNGVAAAVSAATVTELTTVVPTSATTGPITVTVGADTASSPADFVVDANAVPPSIASVSPTAAMEGTVITTQGQYLYPVANQTTIQLGWRGVSPSTLSNTQAVFTVPANFGSGKVTVKTPYGTAVSAQDVLVAPSGIAVADIVQSKRLVLDEAAQGFSVSATGQYAAALFDGTMGQYLSAQFTSISVASINWSFYGTDNVLLTSGTATPASPSIHLPKVSATGTYLLLMKPVSGPATWNLAIENSKSVAVNGSTLSVATTVLGQGKRLTFLATVGQNLGLGLNDLVITAGTGSYVNVTAYKPDGTSLTSDSCYSTNNGCDLNLTNLSAGTYSVIVAPVNSSQTMSFTSTLSSDVTGTLAQNTVMNLSLARRGQNGRMTFAGTAGETVALQIAGQTTEPASRTAYYYVYKPDGTLLKSTTATSAGMLNLPNLPTTGNYTVFVDPYYGETLTAQLTLATGTTSGMALNGASGSFATTVPGQHVYLTFTATAGQNLGLGLSDLVITAGTGTYVYVTAYKPDGTALTNDNCYSDRNGCDLNLTNLAAGTYSVIVTPLNSDQTMSFATTLSSDATGTLAQNTVMNLSLARRGQNGRLTFAGTAGETVALQVAGQTTVPASRTAYYYVYKPDGTTLASTNTTSAKTLNLPNLPATGNYTVFVDPYYGETLTAQLTLATGTTSGMALNGASGSFATTVPGQNVYLTFTATAGQNLGLGLSDLVITAGTGTYVNVTAYKPDGASLTSSSCYSTNNGCDLNLTNLSAGTYSVIVTPKNSDQTMSFASTLSSEATGTLAQNTAMNLSLARRGQNGRLTFAGTAGEPLALQVAGQTTVPASRAVYYQIYNPDGTLLTSTSATSAATFNLLPATTGNYTVFVDPSYGATMTAQLTLATGMKGEMAVNGANGSFATTVLGQYVYLTFTATAGQNLGLGLSDLVITAGTGTYVYVTAYKPDGTSLTSGSCYPANNGCDLNLANLSAGTYSVIVAPPYSDQTMSFTSTLSSDVTGTLAQNTAMNLSLARPGQNGRLTFAGTAGETVALQIASQTTVPASRAADYYVYKPDGTLLLKSTTATSAATLNLTNLPTTGNYMVFVDPYYGETLTAQLTLATGTTSEMALNGASGSFATTVPGQHVYLTFAATAGQNLGLGLSDLVVTAGTDTYVNVTAYKPDGTSLTSSSCYSTNNGCDLNLTNLTAGTYSVIAAPGKSNQTISFTSTLSSDVTGTLAQNTVMNLGLARRGQNGRLTFAGTAGEPMMVQIAGQTTVPASRAAYYYVYNPDGTLLTSTTTTSATALNILPATTGNYTVFVDPYYGETLTAQLMLATAMAGEVAVNGASGSFATTVPGQNVYLTFTATVGQNLGLGLSDLVITAGTGTYFKVTAYKPDGTSLTSDTCYPGNSGCDLDLTNLAAGTYSVIVAPVSSDQTISFTSTLSSDVAGTLAQNTAMNLSLARRGQNGRLTFAGTAGETVALQIAGQTTVPASRLVSYMIYKPDGTFLESTSTTSATTLNLSNLPTTGNYTVFVDPYYGAALTAQLMLDTTP